MPASSQNQTHRSASVYPRLWQNTAVLHFYSLRTPKQKPQKPKIPFIINKDTIQHIKISGKEQNLQEKSWDTDLHASDRGRGV